MKIGSANNANSMKINVVNLAEEREKIAEQSQQPEVESEDAETQENHISISAKPLNMMAGSFVHADGANDDDNYSLMNLNGIKSQQNLMAKFNTFMVDLVADRMVYTDKLIESGLSVTDAKAAAAAEFEKKGVEAHKKLGKELSEEELEKQAEETKEFTEERTEDVVEEKQEEKAAEAKEAEEEAEAKVEDKIAANAREAVEGTSADEGGGADPVAAKSGALGAEPLSSDAGPAQKGDGVGENVDEFV
ncbi:hypothetical protein [Desulfovibrio sp. JC010]|uniref:hypothetical protein n=1 Tax=Desulfovibrio sp. JC010 TaxID=2593641 RepID=UPI0013D81AF6|nr:hypothetical protein [Desulfovibrio sp. JC010]NDV26659.1 hypothetical protein [Desulfovibrio sp. JC010]